MIIIFFVKVVKKIYVNSVQNDLNTPFEYKKLALHVEGPVLWIYDTSTLRRFYNDNPNDWDIDETRVYRGRWNDCSWDECDSIFDFATAAFTKARKTDFARKDRTNAEILSII